jgi:hypothetical protein
MLFFYRERLRTCQEQHGTCNQPDAVPLPKRIIYVGKSNEELRLKDTDNTQGLYAILSYCWGESQNLLKTTSTSLEKHMEGIPFTRLPKTIQDAVEVARELSIDYLWVDSLCIIQGSQEDWEIESAKMSEYFGNAHITIAASSASNAQAGILAARHGVPEPVKEETELRDGTICTFLVQERNNKFDNLSESVHHFGPLSDRGWAFQENVLSTRTIHYTDSELVWECCTETISESGFMVGSNSHAFFAQKMLELYPSPSQLWQDLVTNFSRRELTYPSDRLPAISGLAQLLQK